MLLFHPIVEEEGLDSNKKYVLKILGIGIKWNTEKGVTGRSDFGAVYLGHVALRLTMHSYIGLDLLMPETATLKVNIFYLCTFFSGDRVTNFRIKTFKNPLQF